MSYKAAKKEITKVVQNEMETVFIIIFLAIVTLIFVPAARQYLTVILTVLALLISLQILRAIGIITEVREYERLAVFRMGHFHRIAGPGWVILFPFFERAVKVDFRVQQMDIQPQEVITADEIRVTVDTIVYYKIKEPEKAILAVKDFEETLRGYIYAALRDIGSNLTLNELYSEIEKVNDIVKVKIEPMVRDWGITIIDVEVQNLRIPEPIQQAMHLRRQSKEEWAAAQYQARAQRTMIEAIAEAASKLDENALSYLYIKEALPKIADGKSTKIVLPAVFPRTPGSGKASDEVMTLNLAGLLGEGFEDGKKKSKKSGDSK
ncbi:MAG: hypothetical protein GOV00_01530 [Candidatus Altiarchaeota archaeon]|nr:hypothetical protein [Candidatus Altiarchaeota archaeon]